ncbi:MAG: SLC13 family permease [Gammaproteobacteria bacterium]
MTFEIALVFLVIAGALYLFASQKLPLDITAFLTLVTVVAIPLVGDQPWLQARGIDLPAAFPTVAEGLSGFSSTATITVLAMFILSAGIERSGLIYLLGKRLFPLVGGSELRVLLMIAALVGLLSGVINNTAAVAVAIPLVLELARRGGLQASRLLIPVSFFGMLGGTLTLIGTSTNILVSSVLSQTPAFGRPLEMFEFTPLGLIVLATGLIYFLSVGRWLLPARDPIGLQGREKPGYLVELRVNEDSPLVGQSLTDADFMQRTGVELVKLVRGNSTHIDRAATLGVVGGDILVVRGQERQIADLIKNPVVTLLSDFGLSRMVRGDGYLVRLLLRGRDHFNGANAAQTDLWGLCRARLLGIETDSPESRRLADQPLHAGDIVLAEVSTTEVANLGTRTDVQVLAELRDDFDRARMWRAGGIVAAVVAGAALTPLPIVVTALAGVIAMVVTRCLSREDLYTGVSWQVIFLLSGVIPLGIAMTKSGAAAWLGELFAAQAITWHPVLVLMALYGVTTLLTEIVSNNASVVILIPVAVSIGQQLGIDVLPLCLAVMFAASTSFLSPVGYQTNTMIYGTGLYRFLDFARVGAPLNALLMVVTSLAIWVLWLR